MQPVRFETQLRDLQTAVVVESEDGSLTVLEVQERDGSTCSVRVTRPTSPDPVRIRRLDPASELGDFAVLHLHARPERAFRLPPGEVLVRHNLSVGLVRALAGLGALLVIIFLFVIPLPPQAQWALSVLVVVGTIAGLALAGRRKPATNHKFRTADGRYALEHILDDRPSALAAGAAVEEIKTEYGRLLSDIVYRIENPALFDPLQEHAKRFTTALIRWDTQQARLDGAELGTLAAEIRVAFETAKAHAESIGMDHIPLESREDASRALKSARLAMSTKNADERRAALKATRQILQSLAIYYLPNPEEAQLMVEGRQLLALPGRRSDSASAGVTDE